MRARAFNPGEHAEARPGRRRITGERVSSSDAGFNPAWHRHSREYELAAGFLPDGLVLDLGCGIGHSYHLLAPRESVGVDVDPGALAGQERRTVACDMRGLPFEDGSFASAVSIHSLEHVPDPERVVAEAARVVAATGTVVFVTPNRLTFGRPDEIIDPYHHEEFDPDQLAALCRERFAAVEIRGLFGSARYMELFDEERQVLDRLLRRDPLRLRRLPPRPVKQRLYDWMLRRSRLADDPRAAAIDGTDFDLRDEATERSLDLFAICRRPSGPR